MFKGNPKQDGRVPDAEDGLRAEIVDIRQKNEAESLCQELRDSLKGGLSGDDEPGFPSRLLWDQQGLCLFEKITYCKEYYPTNSEIEILEANSRKIAKEIAGDSIVVDFGSG